MISTSIISCINYKFCRVAWPALETRPTVSAVDFAMTVSPTAVMSGSHAVEVMVLLPRPGTVRRSSRGKSILSRWMNSWVLPRPRESGQHLARELARAPAAVIQLTHARDSALERDDRAASEVETRLRPR